MNDLLLPQHEIPIQLTFFLPPNLNSIEIRAILYHEVDPVWKSKKYEDIEETYYDINDSFFAHRPILEGFVHRKYISFPRNMISAEVYGNGSVYLATPGSERSVLLVNSEDKWDILKPSFFDALFNLISFVADENNFFMKIYHYQNISLPINYQQQSTLPSFISYSLPELFIPNKKGFVYFTLNNKINVPLKYNAFVKASNELDEDEFLFATSINYNDNFTHFSTFYIPGKRKYVGLSFSGDSELLYSRFGKKEYVILRKGEGISAFVSNSDDVDWIGVVFDVAMPKENVRGSIFINNKEIVKGC